MLNAYGSSITPGSSCAIGVFFDPTASGSRTGILTITDNAASSPQTVTLTGTGQDFSMAASGGTSATVSPGQSANYTLTIAPGGGFNHSVALSCSGAPAGSTCLLSTNSVNLSGSNSTTVQVAVTTAGNSASLTSPFDVLPTSGNRLAMWPALSGLPGLALVGMWVGCSRKRRSRVLFGLAVLCLAVGTCSSGCGGGQSMKSGGSGGTPAGTYTISVTGTFSSGATSLTHTTKLTMIVQ